jgi:hypothetical protein
MVKPSMTAIEVIPPEAVTVLPAWPPSMIVGLAFGLLSLLRVSTPVNPPYRLMEGLRVMGPT